MDRLRNVRKHLRAVRDPLFNGKTTRGHRRQVTNIFHSARSIRRLGIAGHRCHVLADDCRKYVEQYFILSTHPIPAFHDRSDSTLRLISSPISTHHLPTARYHGKISEFTTVLGNCSADIIVGRVLPGLGASFPFFPY